MSDSGVLSERKKRIILSIRRQLLPDLRAALMECNAAELHELQYAIAALNELDAMWNTNWDTGEPLLK